MEYRMTSTTDNMTVKTYQIKGSQLIYKMPKELDHHVADPLCKELDMLVESYQIMELVLDFKDTEFMDSSGIGVVIGRSKTMQFRGGILYVMHLRERVSRIFYTAGLYKIVKEKER